MWRIGVILLVAISSWAGDVVQRRENFEVDPKWETYSTRRPPAPWPTVKQDFRWQPGKVGGLVSRSTEPAWFARVLPNKTLEHPLKASGKFRVTKNFGNSGVLFGWFNDASRGWRTPNSLVFRLDGNGPGYWVFFEYGTRNSLTAGKGCFEGDRYQTTKTKPFPADGTEHTWSLQYHPAGLITFVLDGKSWTLPVDEETKKDGAIFNRFGILNQQLSGDGMEVWFSEIVLDGERIDLSRDPDWEAHGAKAEFSDKIVRPFNNTEWRAGEFGGVFWRDDPPAFCATAIRRVSLEDELFASGQIRLTAAATDSGVYFGWFNAASKTNRGPRDQNITQTNSLAIAIEGPSRVGQYFRAATWNSKGIGVLQSTGPLIPADSKPRRWSLRYSPQGRGRVTVTLDEQSTSLELPEGMREQGAIFDHFGFFNFQPDGHYVRVFVDDLEFSASASK